MNDKDKALWVRSVEEMLHAKKRGRWMACEDVYEICATEFTCSICKTSFCSSEMDDNEFRLMMKYCPNCGAKMDAEG